MDRDELIAWLQETDEARLADLWARADAVRRGQVGEAVHLRGLIEVSNHCVRRCAYCGINVTHTSLERYRMTADEILDGARQARELGYGTVVLQAGEDYGLTQGFVADVVCAIKAETGLAVTLSLGERPDDDFVAWWKAGADRYLLRFETSDPDLYARIHPALPGRPSDRFIMLRRLREIGFEIGSGVMIGIPGQTHETLADDLLAFACLDLDMIGVGPYLPHPDTPMGRGAIEAAPAGQQVHGDEQMTYKVVALARLVCPQANIPATTALATLNLVQGRELGLSRGANVVMPNLTPVRFRALYEIYPGKACIGETAEACAGCLSGRIVLLGRQLGHGPGGRGKGEGHGR